MERDVLIALIQRVRMEHKEGAAYPVGTGKDAEEEILASFDYIEGEKEDSHKAWEKCDRERSTLRDEAMGYRTLAEARLTKANALAEAGKIMREHFVKECAESKAWDDSLAAYQADV